MSFMRLRRCTLFSLDLVLYIAIDIILVISNFLLTSCQEVVLQRRDLCISALGVLQNLGSFLQSEWLKHV